VLCVGAFLVYSVISWRAESGAKAKRLDEVKQSLAKLESGLADAALSPHDRAALLVRIVNARTESVMPLLPRNELHDAEQANRRDTAEIARLSSVTLPAEPGQPGADFIVPSAFLDMAGIPAGKFRMGGSMDNEMPVREVTVTHPFWIARTEVTNRQIQMLIPGFNSSKWGDFRLNLPSQPAVRVRWDQAVMFCRKLTELERAAGRLPSGYEYRLPTEAEWEYACRAGASTDYYWGKEFGNEGAKYANGLDYKSAERFQWRLPPISGAADDDGYRVTAPVGKFGWNPWRLSDMSGNAAEWCYDWYDSYSSSAQTDPTGAASGFSRVYRGGAWCSSDTKNCSSTVRNQAQPTYRDFGVGFRLALQ
jgi:formylglycine-generating enzyme required for sulfatase activity